MARPCFKMSAVPQMQFLGPVEPSGSLYFIALGMERHPIKDLLYVLRQVRWHVGHIEHGTIF